MQMRSMKQVAAIAGLVGALLTGSASAASAAVNSSNVGQACTVTSGPNAGKSGTVTIDEDGSVWCEGTWGGTQCGTKCDVKKAPAPVRRAIVVGIKAPLAVAR